MPEIRGMENVLTSVRLCVSGLQNVLGKIGLTLKHRDVKI